MKHRFRRRFLYILFLFIAKAILLCPLNIGLALGKFLGFLAYLLLPQFSNVAKENLRNAFNKEKSAQQINKIAKDTFCNLGICAIEALNMPKIKRRLDKKIYAVGLERVNKALGQGK